MATQCATEVDDNPLWNFALQFYARPQVQQLLLTLQNDQQQDTVLMLAALWLADNGHNWPLSGGQLQAYTHWHQQVIRPLRAARKAIHKSTSSNEQQCLRQHIQQDEIRAEQLALHQLFVLLPATSSITDKDTLRHQALHNLFAQAQLQPGADIKKEALRPLFQQLVQLL